MNDEPHLEDRVAERSRPDGTPIMHQSWGKLLFMHWGVPVDSLRPHVPPELEIDTFKGNAYIALTPFTMWDVRPVFTPPIPWLSAFHELNCRTYVHLGDEPGVWFFSLDANSALGVWGARLIYHLPYFYSQISLLENNGTIDYTLRRTAETRAHFSAKWTVESDEPFHAIPGSLEFFLTERYCLFTEHNREIYRCRIHHEAWPLRFTVLNSFETDIFAANGLQTPDGDPMVHCGGPVEVEIWPLEAVGENAKGAG
jgi:uncharacterized protein YqjF (DUF2071 family)